MKRRDPPGGLLVLFLASAFPVPGVSAPESPRFVLERIVATSGAEALGSPRFGSGVTAGADSPAGAASFCNSGFRASLGFWSIRGDLPVPIRLTVRRNAADPEALDLEWTGAADRFRIFGSFTPENVLDPAHLYGETTVCRVTDSLAFQSDVLYYRVVPTP